MHLPGSLLEALEGHDQVCSEEQLVLAVAVVEGQSAAGVGSAIVPIPAQLGPTDDILPRRPTRPDGPLVEVAGETTQGPCTNPGLRGWAANARERVKTTARNGAFSMSQKLLGAESLSFRPSFDRRRNVGQRNRPRIPLVSGRHNDRHRWQSFATGVAVGLVIEPYLAFAR